MRHLALLLSALALSLVACSAEEAPGTPDEDRPEDDLTAGTNSDQWVYNGKLPHLEDPSIVVSRTAHTVRVTGLLPQDFQGELPFFVDSVQENGRTRIATVYPIATGSSVNHAPGDYWTERLYPRRTDSSAAWGGFPFISYVNDTSPYQGIAFHGPITASDGEWSVVRGPVSHGCNRMQGEHVVELAHLIGIDMTTRLWGGGDILRDRKIPVTVLKKPDTWQGQQVDVDYKARAGVQRPAGDVKMFAAWRSQDFPTWVCRVDRRHPPPARDVPTDYCASALGLRDRYDAVSGPPASGAAPVVADSSCPSATLGRDMPENACVQASSDRLWHRCVAGEWADSSTSDAACTERHPL